MAESTVEGRKNQKVGQVVSIKTDKTVVVQVTRRVRHRLYKRVLTRKKKYHAHDEENVARVGDVVQVIECRPMSRLKRWRLGKIVRQAVQVGARKKQRKAVKRESAGPSEETGG